MILWDIVEAQVIICLLNILDIKRSIIKKRLGRPLTFQLFRQGCSYWTAIKRSKHCIFLWMHWTHYIDYNCFSELFQFKDDISLNLKLLIFQRQTACFKIWISKIQDFGNFELWPIWANWSQISYRAFNGRDMLNRIATNVILNPYSPKFGMSIFFASRSALCETQSQLFV